MKSWRTTLLGAIGASWLVLEPLISQGAIDWKKAAIAAFVAVFGYLVKDSNVTGVN